MCINQVCKYIDAIVVMFIVNCLQYANDDVTMILCGNKCDLSDIRVISKERGLSLAEEYGMRFIETSAKASINVEEVLTMLLSV